MNTLTGTISVNGSPTAAGTLSFTVTVTDYAGAQLVQNYSITINPALALTPSSLTLPSGAFPARVTARR